MRMPWKRISRRQSRGEVTKQEQRVQDRMERPDCLRTATIQGKMLVEETGRQANSLWRSDPALLSVSGCVEAGTFLVILGGSGCGKTTLLTTLASRAPRDLIIHGEVNINSHVIPDLFDRSIASGSGFLHQDNLFYPTLTVREHLRFMVRRVVGQGTTRLAWQAGKSPGIPGKSQELMVPERHSQPLRPGVLGKSRSSKLVCMKLGGGIKKAERERRVEEVMDEVGLRSAASTVIGSPATRKGISGGEQKRLAFASEVITDPPLLFCDEPTSGLDSNNAERIVKMMQELSRRGKTVICTIHQPSSRIFSLFTNIMFLVEGRLACHGPKEDVLQFFTSIGHECPSRYNPADFLINVLAMAALRRGTETENEICDAYSKSDLARNVQGDIAEQFTDYDYDSGSLIFQSIPRDQRGIQALAGAMFYLVCEAIYPVNNRVLNIFPRELHIFNREYQAGLYHVHSFYASKAILLNFATLDQLDPVLVLLPSGIRGTHDHSVLRNLEHQYVHPFAGPSDSHSTPILSCCGNEVARRCFQTGDEVLDSYAFSTSMFSFDALGLVVLFFVFHLLGYLLLLLRARKS
ncbi:unnamed protein product [Darwinula stevensoni]|uniref:ABC transporter domain-containing protein n=1 Tax=Darwinula stevensoni TaxID=69355 RepID=A0A7R8X291_9CRUS|nr:unnamed protein product [Darwinula stevensoni]CAG0883696.1 unnamed protein product [Darwinula stevensoni]